jgi:hypothetical protein
MVHFEAIQYFKRKPLSLINSITQPGTLTANTDTLMASIGHLTCMSSATLSQPLYDMLRVSTSTLLSLSQSQGLYWHCHDLYNQYPGLYILQALSSWHVLVHVTSTVYHHLLTTPAHGFYNIPHSWLLLTILQLLQYSQDLCKNSHGPHKHSHNHISTLIVSSTLLQPVIALSWTFKHPNGI